MMRNSERSAFIGGNISPRLKDAIERYVDLRRKDGSRISLSRVVERALQELMEREGMTIEPLATDPEDCPLPFEDEPEELYVAEPTAR